MGVSFEAVPAVNTRDWNKIVAPFILLSDRIEEQVDANAKLEKSCVSGELGLNLRREREHDQFESEPQSLTLRKAQMFQLITRDQATTMKSLRDAHSDFEDLTPSGSFATSTWATKIL